jgi:hypothetical protein
MQMMCRIHRHLINNRESGYSMVVVWIWLTIAWPVIESCAVKNTLTQSGTIRKIMMHSLTIAETMP